MWMTECKHTKKHVFKNMVGGSGKQHKKRLTYLIYSQAASCKAPPTPSWATEEWKQGKLAELCYASESAYRVQRVRIACQVYWVESSECGIQTSAYCVNNFFLGYIMQECKASCHSLNLGPEPRNLLWEIHISCMNDRLKPAVIVNTVMSIPPSL